MHDIPNCPFCDSDIRPSPGLAGTYQHSANVHECIIGDLGITDLDAWSRRALGNWRSMETAPTDEDEPFLVLTPGNDLAAGLVLQVSRFEGRLYPDGLNGLIDWVDGVENALGWMPLPRIPKVLHDPEST